LGPYALLNSLVVHPGFRQQGVGSALVGWLVDHSRNRLGVEGVIWALIQHGNFGSERTVGKYLKHFISDRIVIVPTKTRANLPMLPPKLMVRPIEPGELGQVADQLNTFCRDFNFYEPETTADSLASWCASTPFDTCFRHYLVVTDLKGAILAGAGVSRLYRLRTLHIPHIPSALYVLNTFLRIVPSDGISKELLLSKIWFGSTKEILFWRLLICGRGRHCRYPRLLSTTLKQCPPIVWFIMIEMSRQQANPNCSRPGTGVLYSEGDAVRHKARERRQ
jgi:hypothetical protein